MSDAMTDHGTRYWYCKECKEEHPRGMSCIEWKQAKADEPLWSEWSTTLAKEGGVMPLAEFDEILAALETAERYAYYGEHNTVCPRYSDSSKPCDCGRSDLFDALARVADLGERNG